jgi:hypothetical protein
MDGMVRRAPFDRLRVVSKVELSPSSTDEADFFFPSSVTHEARKDRS